MSSLETLLLVLVVGERVITKTWVFVTSRRRARGSGLEKAYRQTGIVMDSLYNLYHELSKTEGFHSLRMLSVHNSGNDLSTTMLWKGTVLATYPHNAEGQRWDEYPLDPEYLTRILRPVSEERRRCVKRSELVPDGAMGASYARLGIEQTYLFLITKNDSEIVFASVSFSSHNMTPAQTDAVHACEARIHTQLKGCLT